jgi:myosin heavy subunit
MHLPFLIFQATDTRDALAKSVYASLFEWLVEQINKSLSVGKRRTGRSISILDIYGFESFDVMYLFFNLKSSYIKLHIVYS